MDSGSNRTHQQQQHQRQPQMRGMPHNRQPTTPSTSNGHGHGISGNKNNVGTTSTTANNNCNQLKERPGIPNFRNHYYEKVGLRSVDEQKALDCILHGAEGFSGPEGKAHHVDLEKLANFASRFPVSGVYRERVWLLLLGLVPPSSHFDPFILSEQKKLCHDVKQCLYLLNLSYNEDDDEDEDESGGDGSGMHVDREDEDDDYAPSAGAKNLTLMYLLEQEQLDSDKPSRDNLMTDLGKRVLSMAHVFSDLKFRLEHEYWLLKEFIRLIDHIRQQQKQASASEAVDSIPGKVFEEISQEDSGLLQHLQSISVLMDIKSNQPCSSSTAVTSITTTVPSSTNHRSSTGSFSLSSSSSSSGSGSPVNSFQLLVPFDSWLASCFAGFIPGCFLIKVWDRVISPPSQLKILVLTAKNYILVHKKEILASRDQQEIRNLLLQPLSCSKSEQMVSKVLEQAWEPV